MMTSWSDMAVTLDLHLRMHQFPFVSGSPIFILDYEFRYSFSAQFTLQ
jgi:hypothetical protein